MSLMEGSLKQEGSWQELGWEGHAPQKEGIVLALVSFPLSPCYSVGIVVRKSLVGILAATMWVGSS